MAISAADLMVKFRADTKDAEAGIKRVDKGITGFAKSAAATMGGFLGAQVFTGIARGFVGAGTAALDFGAQMANVNSIMQLSDEALAEYSDQVLALASDPRVIQSPAQLAAGLYDVASSGFTGADGLKVMEAASIAATAGLTDSAVAGKAITAVLNAYGLTADDAAHASDVLFQTVNEGVITFPELAANMGNTLAAANSLGISFEELGAAYAQMTLKGISGSIAETQIAAVMRSASNPTEELTAAVQAHGFASAQAAIESEGFAGFLKIVDETAAGNKETMFDLLGTQEAVNAATILGKDGAEDYIKSIDRMNKSSEGAGATNKALEKQMQSASFQIAKAKQSLLTFATIGLGLFAPAIGRVASGLTTVIQRGLIPFTKVIGAAFKGNFQFNKLLDKVPQPLRRAAHAIGVVTEALSDMVSIMRGRISPARLAGEFLQAWHGIQALGQEIGQGLRFIGNIAIDLVTSFTGWLWDNKGAIWDGIKTLVGWGAGKFSDLVSVTIDGAIALAGDLADAAGDLWGWIKAKLFGGPTVNDMLNPFNGGAQNSNTIDIGVVDVLLKLGTIIIDAAGDAITAAAAAIKAALGTIPVKADWTLILGTPSIEFDTDYQSAEQRAQSIKDSIGEISIPSFDWKMILAVPLILNPLFAATLAGAAIEAAIVNNVLPVLWIPEVLIPQILYTGWYLIPEQVRNTFQTFLDIADTTFELITNIDIPDFTIDTTAAELAVVNAIAAIGVKIDELKTWSPDFGFIGDAIQGALDAITAPTLPTWLADLGWITDKISALTGYIGELLGLQQQVASLSTSINAANVPGLATDMPSGILRQAPPGYDPGIIPVDVQPQRLVYKVDADVGPFNDKLKGLFGGGAEGKAKTFTAVIDADNGPFAVAYTEAFGWGDTFANQTFESTLAADNGPAAIAYTDASQWGSVWDAANFVSTFDIDNGPAAQAYTAAFGWGQTWAAQVFTARFSVDTSGLIAAVNVAAWAAQQIRDLMPSSPARKGPLSKPISFDYIADAFRDSMRGLSGAMGGVGGRHRLSPAAMRSDGAVTQHFYAVKSDEFTRLLRNAEDGGNFARNFAPEYSKRLGT